MRIHIEASDIETARRLKVFPATLTLDRIMRPISVRSNMVCAILWFKDRTRLKMKFPFELWDWGMRFIQGEPVEPVTMTFNPAITGKDVVLIDPYEKDFRTAETLPFPTAEATWTLNS